MPEVIPDWAQAVDEPPDWARDTEVPEWAAPTPLTPEQMTTLGAQIERDQSQRAAISGGMEAGTEFLTAVVNDPVGAAKAIPEIILGAATAPGRLAYDAAADVMAKVARPLGLDVQVAGPDGGSVTRVKQDYGGNLRAGMTGEDKPVDKFLASVARTNPKSATAGFVARDIAAMSPLAGIGLLPAGLAQLASAGFTVDMIRHAPALFEEYAAEINKPAVEQDPGKIAELKSGIIQTFTFAPLAGAHATRGVPQQISVALDNARRLTPEGKPRPPVDRRAAQPAEEGAPVPEWAAETVQRPDAPTVKEVAAPPLGDKPTPPKVGETTPPAAGELSASRGIPAPETAAAASPEAAAANVASASPGLPPPRVKPEILSDETAATGSRYIYAVVDGNPFEVRVATHAPGQTRGGSSRMHRKALAERFSKLPYEIDWRVENPDQIKATEIETIIRQIATKDFLAEESNIAQVTGHKEPQLEIFDPATGRFKQKALESGASRTINDSLKSAPNQIQTESQMVKSEATPPQPAAAVRPQASASPGLPPTRAAEAGPTPGAGSSPQSAIGNRQSAIEVTPRHLKEATKALRLEERPPDIFDDIEPHFRGKVKFPAADFKDTVARARGTAKERMSLTEGEPVDRVLQALALENRKYADWTADQLAEAMLAAGETRIGQRTPNPAKVRQLAEDMAVAEKEKPVDDPFAEVMEGVTGNEPELIGMGGAIPAEFKHSPQSPTSIKNAQVEIERAQRGLPPAIEPARRTFGRVWEEAMALVDAAPERQDRLIEQLRDRPRALTDVEDALLLQRQIDLQNAYGKATRDLAQAFDDAQRFPDRLEAVEMHKLQVQSLSDRLQELYDINKAAGTETGRGLAARRMLAYEDYSLARMEVEKRAANEGRPLTDGERAEITRLQQKIAETQKAFDEYQAKAEAERAERVAKEETDALINMVAKGPGYDRHVVSLADRVVNALERQAEAARERLKGKFSRTAAGVDPTILSDLAIIGASKIARGTLDFTRWSKEMVTEFGETVVPWLNQAWLRSNAQIDSMVDRVAKGKTAEKVKRGVRKEDVSGQRASIIEGIKEAAKEKRPLPEIGDYVRKLAENFVRSGIHEREPLITAVHDVLKAELDPGITRRQAMDAISGYGEFKALSTDAIKMKLRDLKGQMQQLGKLEDLQNRQPVPKTGVERRVPTNEERRLIQQVNEAKRRYGMVTTDPARQLKGALEAIKTRLTHQIADLEFQIRTKEKIVKTRTPAPFDNETKLLELRRDELKQQFEAIFPRRPRTEAQRAQTAMRAIERTIADYEMRIQAGDVSVRAAKPLITTPALEALRARREAVKAEYQELVDLLDPGRRERAALSGYKARLATATAGYADRLARGDFAPRARPERRLDNEALKLKTAHEQAKAEFHRGLIKDRLARRTIGQKIYAGVKEAVNLPRTILSSWDVSAVLRQGGFITLGHPVRALRSIGPMFRALGSERRALMIEQEILNRPNAPDYKRSKLYLAPHESLVLSAMEEQIMSRVANRVPGVRASNRAYITFLNKLRADSFDAIKASIESRGPSLSPLELQAIANYINVATGRGDLGKAAGMAEGLATVFFSPRLMASRFQLIARPLMGFRQGGETSFRVRKAMAVEYARFLAGMAVIYGLAELAGAEIEHDSRSSDFGKLRFGNTRVDPLAGLAQNTVLLTRLATGETMKRSGELRPIRGERLPYGSDTAADVIARFLRSKLSPVVGAGVDVLSGSNVVGEPTTPATVAQRLTVPLSFQDIYETMLEQGMPRGTALAMLSLFGWGIQTYE